MRNGVIPVGLRVGMRLSVGRDSTPPCDVDATLDCRRAVAGLSLGCRWAVGSPRWAVAAIQLESYSNLSGITMSKLISSDRCSGISDAALFNGQVIIGRAECPWSTWLLDRTHGNILAGPHQPICLVRASVFPYTKFLFIIP